MTPMIDLSVHITLTPEELPALLAAAFGTSLAWRDFARALHDARAPRVLLPQPTCVGQRGAGIGWC